jgi:hypothetical protein
MNPMLWRTTALALTGIIAALDLLRGMQRPSASTRRAGAYSTRSKAWVSTSTKARVKRASAA